jgi:hypothetical protein
MITVIGSATTYCQVPVSGSNMACICDSVNNKQVSKNVSAHELDPNPQIEQEKCMSPIS